jgi:hypothetical protein
MTKDDEGRVLPIRTRVSCHYEGHLQRMESRSHTHEEGCER